MKKRNQGISLVILTIIIIVIIGIAGIAIVNIIGDNGVVSNALKMDVDTAKGEVRDNFLKLVNDELVSASESISGTSEEINTKYNEIALINFLKGNKNYSDESGHAEKNAICCIEEFEGDSDGAIDLIAKGGDGLIKSKYRVISKALSSDIDKYGVGKHISDGNIFTLEAVITKDDDGNDIYDGKFELKYYDENGKESVLETVSLYLTKQS